MLHSVRERKTGLNLMLNVSISGNLHLVARNDGQDLTYWSLLAKHIDTER